MAKTFQIDVIGGLFCDQRPAQLSDVVDIQLNVAKFSAETLPIPATIISVESKSNLCDDSGATGKAGFTYTLSVADEDMPPGLEILQRCDISSIICNNCCNTIDRRSVQKWRASAVVQIGDVRLSPEQALIEAPEARTTGASFDAAEAAEWTLRRGPFGQIRLTNVPTVVVAAKETFYAVAVGTWELETLSHLWAMTVSSQLDYAGVMSRPFRVVANMKLHNAGAGDTQVAAQISKNGTPIADSHRLGFAGNTVNGGALLVLEAIASMDEGDYFDVHVSNETNADDLVIDDLTLTVMPL